MNIEIENKLLNVKNILIVFAVLVFSFLIFNSFVSAFPIGNYISLNEYDNIFPDPGNLDNILNFDIQALISGSLSETLKDLSSFDLLKDLYLPLGSGNFLPDKSEIKTLNLRDFLNPKDINTSNLKDAARSVIILSLKLFLIAIVSIAQVLKVFIDIVVKNF